jgi:hypothetical protein
VFYFCRRFSCRTQKSRLPQAQKRKGPTTSVTKSLDLLVHLAHQQANYSLYAASGYFSLVEHQFSARLWRTA